MACGNVKRSKKKQRKKETKQIRARIKTAKSRQALSQAREIFSRFYPPILLSKTYNGAAITLYDNIIFRKRLSDNDHDALFA